jgi:hypothetical protein
MHDGEHFHQIQEKHRSVVCQFRPRSHIEVHLKKAESAANALAIDET